MVSILTRILGDSNEKFISSLRPLIDDINFREDDFAKLNSEELKLVSEEFKRRLKEGESLDDILPEAFAAVREAAKRTIGLRHFDVQLIGGVVLHQGRIAEMKTGEGKTLVATLPLYLNSLAGMGAHLITPNDYLSRIGAGWMAPVYYSLGASIAVLAHEWQGIYDPNFNDPSNHADNRLNHFRPCTRAEAYHADITYGTNNEFGFDYLRDNLEYLPVQLRQKGYNFAIVDEVDSILIDEARTPLIISQPDIESGDLYKTFAKITPQLKENADYNVDEKMKAVSLTEEGIDKVERILGVKNIYEEKGIRFVHHLEQALKAQALYHRDKEYVVKDGEIIIVDEFTGRLMPGRRWSEGLHQAVEAKEGVKIQKESRTLATITFQNYFRMYKKLSGMTGTAQTSAEEFHKVYNLDVISIPTHRPMIRQDSPDLIFQTEEAKLRAVAREVKKRSELGQPVLIGTISIEKNERLSKILQVEGVKHELLNAKNHEREALIIAQAGKRGAVTVATNMAGRGVDILLGGNPIDKKEADDVRGLGGLHVIGTERHEARRIDNQLRGRAGRQGDPGSSQFFVSLEDDLMRVFGSEKIKNMMSSFGIAVDEPIETKIVSRAIESAQAKIEGLNFDARKYVLDFDDVLNKQRDAVYRMRKEVLMAQAKDGVLKEKLFKMFEASAEKIVFFHSAGPKDEWNVEEIFENLKSISGAHEEVLKKMREITDIGKDSEIIRQELIDFMASFLKTAFNEREDAMGQNDMYNISRVVFMRSIDMFWMEHLDEMQHLRDSVRLRAYGQKDPLVEYKNEGSRLFGSLQDAIESEVVGSIFKIGGLPRQENNIFKPEFQKPAIEGFSGNINTSNKNQSVVSINSTKVQGAGRNDPCPCGSGKKYKKCHGL